MDPPRREARDRREPCWRGAAAGDCRLKRVLCLTSEGSQASEGMWGMPGHTEARKAVVSCDKPGGAAHTH